MISLILDAPSVANSMTCGAASSPVTPFLSPLVRLAILRGAKVVVEEVQFGDPVEALNGSIPPRAALVISIIGDAGHNALHEMVAQIKAAEATAEPRAKMARHEVPTIHVHELVEALKNQGLDISAEDVGGSSVQQLKEMIAQHLGPEQWYERVQTEWADRMLFRVLPYRPFEPFAAEKMPLAWRDGVEDPPHVRRVIGLVPPESNGHLEHVLRPCFSSMNGFTMPSPRELQALGEWQALSLQLVRDRLISDGRNFAEAVQMLQDEYYAAVCEAPHAGVGVPKSRAGIFSTIRVTSQHIHECQRCLKMMEETRQAFVTGFGLLSVFAFLFGKMGANTARGTCALLMMLAMQLFVGTIGNNPIAAAILLVGATSIGKTFILDMLRKMIPTFMQDSAASKSDMADLTGDILAGLWNVLVNSSGIVNIMNELLIKITTANVLNRFGDAYQDRTSAQAPEKGVRPSPILTMAIWICNVIFAATNSVSGNNQPDPAVEQRFTRFTGMNIPSHFAAIWPDKHAERESNCARQIAHLIQCGIALQCGGINFFCDAVPAFPWAISAMQALLDQKNITPRALASMRGSIPAAFIADRTAGLLLSNEPVTMTDLLIARCIPVPPAFALAMLQPVAGTGHDSNHQAAFANMSVFAELPSKFRHHEMASDLIRSACVPRGFVTFPDYPRDDVKKRNEMLLGAARGVTVDAQQAALAIAPHVVSWKRIDEFGISTELLTIQPNQRMIENAIKVLSVFDRLLSAGLLLLDEKGEHVYFAHAFLRWLNAQEGPDVDIYDALANKRVVVTRTMLQSGRELVVQKRPKIPVDDDGNEINDGQAEIFDDDMNTLRQCMSELNELRTRGLVFALFHCGLEYPYVLNTNDYKIDNVLQSFIVDAPKKKGKGQGEEEKPHPLTYYHGPDALKSLDVPVNHTLPARMMPDYFRESAAGVPPSLRHVGLSMRMPYPIAVPLANNGSYVIQPQCAKLTYGDTLMDKHTTPNFQVGAHPNDMTGDAVTFFVDGEFVNSIAAYAGTIQTAFYCAEDLLQVPDFTDAAICRVGEYDPAMPITWDINPQKEIELMAVRPTSTVRMVVLALLIHAVGASNRLRYPGRFVNELTEIDGYTKLVPAIVRFIVNKMSTEHLVRCCPKTAEKLLKQNATPQTEFLRSMISRCDPPVYDDLCKRIDKWYKKLHNQIHTKISPSTFDNIFAAFAPRDWEKELFGV